MREARVQGKYAIPGDRSREVLEAGAGLGRDARLGIGETAGWPAAGILFISGRRPGGKPSRPGSVLPLRASELQIREGTCIILSDTVRKHFQALIFLERQKNISYLIYIKKNNWQYNRRII